MPNLRPVWMAESIRNVLFSRIRLAIPGVTTSTSCAATRPLFAHERVEVGPYVIIVGWETEPVIVGERNALFFEITEDGEKQIIAKGGKGGLGNWHFRSSTNQTPRYAQPGMPPEERDAALLLDMLNAARVVVSFTAGTDPRHAHAGAGQALAGLGGGGRRARCVRHRGGCSRREPDRGRVAQPRLPHDRAGQAPAVATDSINVAAFTRLELLGTLSTGNQGGFVFDYYGDNEFKFIALDVHNNEVLIGHYLNGQLSIDAAVGHELRPVVAQSLPVAADDDVRGGVKLVGRRNEVAEVLRL